MSSRLINSITSDKEIIENQVKDNRSPGPRWRTMGEIPTALTKLRRPILLFLFAALRFLLIFFFGGGCCPFAQMGLSLERLTRPRSIIFTNLFIMALLLFAVVRLNRYAIASRPLKLTAVRALGNAAEETWKEEKKTELDVQVCEGGRDG